MVEVKAQLRNFRMSSKKIRLVTDSIKGMDVGNALIRLRFINKAAAPVVEKLLNSAIANAEHNNSLQKDDLIVKNIVVNQAIALKRWRPAAHGAAHPLKKHGSHIVITLQSKAKPVEIATKSEKSKSSDPAKRKAIAEPQDAEKKIITKRTVRKIKEKTTK